LRFRVGCQGPVARLACMSGESQYAAGAHGRRNVGLRIKVSPYLRDNYRTWYSIVVICLDEQPFLSRTS
jgi:hypothetical protein